MSGIRSLGLHKPAALSYLIDQGTLPESCSSDAYTWETFESGTHVDELISTKTHVVWSGSSNVFRVFSFDVEKEPVRQALFAFFPAQESSMTNASTPPTELKVPKRQGKDSQGSASARPLHAGTRKPGSTAPVGLERAVVVLLQSHAQIFFLSGARSLIPFQFEVERAFPLDQGLLFQRKQTLNSAAYDPRSAPKTPLNSFALTQPYGPSPGVPRSIPADESAPPFIKGLFESVIAGHQSHAQANVPYHYHLSDPFSDLGVLTNHDLSRDKESHRLDESLLDRDENLVYVSCKDEARQRPGHLHSDPLQLAVTVNAAQKTLSIWQVSRPRAQTFWRPNRRFPSLETDRKKRRRSSQPGTGAVTPTARQSMGTRESFIGNQESLGIHDQVRDDGDLAAKLDPAFQNPRAPGHSSRRISSMLARSDLAGMDMFGDGTGGPAVGTGGRRAPSFGGVPNRGFRGPMASRRDLRNSMLSAPESLNGEISEDDEDEIKTARHMLVKLMSQSNGLKVDLRLTQLYNVDFDPSPSQDVHVFTIPSVTARETHEELTVCVMNRTGSELLLIQAQAAFQDKMWQLKLGSVRRSTKIVDACIFRGDESDKLAILGQSQTGSFELTLRSPRTSILSVHIPPQFLINFPYTLQAEGLPASKRATGPRRRLDTLPLPLNRIEAGAGRRQLIVTDRNGSQHLLELDVRPKNGFVRRCIAICDAVLKNPKADRERFLQGWAEARKFLSSRKCRHPDPEWTAFVLLIFGLCCPSHAEQRPRTPFRSKRKSGALLRSSSGAAVDLENFHSVIAQESCYRAPQPGWLTASPWQWAVNGRMGEATSTGSGLGLSNATSKGESETLVKQSSFIVDCAQLGRDFAQTEAGKLVQDNLEIRSDPEDRVQLASSLLPALHLVREELKLDLLATGDLKRITPILAQLGGWLGWQSWSWDPLSVYMDDNVDMNLWAFEGSLSATTKSTAVPDPPSVLRVIAESTEQGLAISISRFTRLSEILEVDKAIDAAFSGLLPRLSMVQALLELKDSTSTDITTHMADLQIDHDFVESLPEGISVRLRSAISILQADPKYSKGNSIPALLEREDIAYLEDKTRHTQGPARSASSLQGHASLRDNHAICKAIAELDPSHSSKTDPSAEVDRAAVTRLIFREDHRVAEAQRLLHPLEPPTVRCTREPEWSEQEFLEAEQELAKVVAIRTLSVSAGRGLLQYGSRSPLLTERFPTHGFTLSCIMKPSNNNVTAEKETLTEEKVSWAFFHAGAEAGLSISRSSKGIDTSWIVFNKPPELNNRHAGFLLALGLNGHLRNIAKWVAFKYLTPKHTMTSVGLLLGLAASYLGTMDTLITRVLSVHVTCMLPAGAAELNLSSLTQTTGIMALGLLYCQTQHRRMTEIMISEIENADEDDSESPLDTLRDEGYRLAAGFALGLINLGQGKNLRGLHDMRIVERLLSLAVSTKQVDLMHILDKSTASATIAIALIFMKTEDEPLARKIDIPDTPHQFEYIRPDLFLLRTVARHLIMWSEIKPSESWLQSQLPAAFESTSWLNDILILDITDLPLYNTIAGLCLAIGLRYAGTANEDACKVLLSYLDQFMRLARLPTLTYDHRLTRTTVRNCQDVVALAASAVMAGTGNIEIFRRLRSLHGRTDPDTPYGSHLAAHQALGVLFLAGGTHTFKTSNLAIACLLCAFYPLFPAAVLDNRGHLQAFRHLWVLATEPRCCVVRDIDSHKPIPAPLKIRLRTGEIIDAQAPCLLPDLSTISTVSLDDPKYWNLTLDFNRATHKQAFIHNQSIFAARKRINGTTGSPFITAMQIHAAGQDAGEANAQSNIQTGSVATNDRQGFGWVFDLPALSRLSGADRTAALPLGTSSLAGHSAMRTSVTDDRLVLQAALEAKRADELWNLRILFAWAENQGEDNEKMGWLEQEVIGRLKAELAVLIAGLEGDDF